MPGTFDAVLILLAVAVAVVVLFRFLALPPILGYLVVGALVGPYGLGWIPDTEDTRALAEFGVVFLLFAIGLEFSLPKLVHMRRTLLGLGGAQVALTAVVTSAIGVLLGMSVEGAVAVGGVVAMSSTAIVIKQLTDQLEIHSPHGRRAVGVLLLQDLAVVPLLIVVASFTAGGEQPLAVLLGWALVKGIAALVAILVLGRWVVRPLFHRVAQTRSMELFTLTALLVALGSAWFTHHMGLSLALGAFVAGMMLAETEFRHQLEANLRPFRDVLLGLFFITIGMLLDVRAVVAFWNWVVLLLAALVVFKTVLITTLSRLAGADNVVALRTGLVLAQGGEFGFAILSVALHGDLMPPDYGQVVLSALFFSMALAPFLIRYNERIARAVFPSTVQVDEAEVRQAVAGVATGLEAHVIVCGYGRVGRNVALFMQEEEIPYLGLDLDPVRVQNARLAGEPVSFGDATHPNILEAAGLERARAVVVAIDDPAAAMKIVRHVHRTDPSLPILVRTRDPSELERLREAGATEVIPETLEASLMIATRLLFLLNVPASRVLRKVRTARGDERFGRGQDPGPKVHPERAPTEVRSVALPPGSPFAGRTLAELPLDGERVEVRAVRRPGARGRAPGRLADLAPEPATRLAAGDVLVLRGAPADLDRIAHTLGG